MAIPHAVLAAGWIPFTVVLVLILLFSFLYIRFYQSKYDSEMCSTITAIAGLSVALITTSLLPVDIFLVSYMKNSDGTFKDWANSSDTRKDIENAVLYGYYALYLCTVLFIFFLLPFAYFFYEEADEDATTRSRCCTAIKYSIIFLFIATVLALVGAFAPVKTIPPQNGTEWDKIKFLFENLQTNNGEDAISFIISCLSLVGMLAALLYTAYGMASWPMDMVKGRRSATTERREVEHGREDTRATIDSIRQKPDHSIDLCVNELYERSDRRMTSRDRRRLDDLEDQERTMERRERHLLAAEGSCLRKCGTMLRPFEILFGVLFFLLALLIFISLLLSSIDKILHSLGWRMGYALQEPGLPNPIDITLVYSQKVFPLDYILMSGIVMYFFFCSMGGIRHLGIWFCCLKMYKIRPRKTKPQGLLFMCFMLMFIVLAINIIMYELTPRYSTYGSQHYVGTVNVTIGNRTSTEHKVMPCSTYAPPGECVMTRMSMLLTRFFYKVWFFGAAYYWITWAFLAVFLLGFVVTLIKKRRSSVDGAVEQDDFEGSDEEMLSS